MSLSRPAEGWTVSLQALITFSIAGRGFFGKSLQSLSTTCSISQSRHETVSRSLQRFEGSSGIGVGDRQPSPSSKVERVRRSSRNLRQYRTFGISGVARQCVKRSETEQGSPQESSSFAGSFPQRPLHAAVGRKSLTSLT